MDEKELTAGLSLLADEFHPGVDVDAAIDTARVRIRRRQAMAATSVGTVLLIAAITAVLGTTGLGGSNQAGSGPSSCPPTSRPTATARPDGRSLQSIPANPSGCAPVNGTYSREHAVDERARKLTNQLAAAKADLFPPNLRIDRDDITRFKESP